MDHFQYRNGQLFAEDVNLCSIAEEFGTPCYVYSRATLERHFLAYQNPLADHPHLICYSVKANSNLAVLNILARLGAGFDIVSAGELNRVIAAGGDPEKVIFSGLGKTEAEITQALEAGIHCFNIESAAELERINSVAATRGVRAPVSIRVNPDVDAGTHPYISTGLKENKFGIDIQTALLVYQRAATMKNIELTGIDCHIGSQLTSIDPFLDSMDRILLLVDKLTDMGIKLNHFDVGGGLGVTYRSEAPPLPDQLVRAVMEKLVGRDLKLLFEPGRSIAANAGILLTRVEYLKPTAQKNFAIVDAAMNDLLRPALYGAWQEILPVVQHQNGEPVEYDVVGPVCESADFLGKKRLLNINQGDLLAVRSCGAYSFVMSSNYNSRCRAPEILVDGTRVHLAREREQMSDLIKLEHILP